MKFLGSSIERVSDNLDAFAEVSVALGTSFVSTSTSSAILTPWQLSVTASKSVFIECFLQVISQATTTGLKLGVSDLIPGTNGFSQGSVYARVPNAAGSTTERNLLPWGAEDMVTGANMPSNGFYSMAYLQAILTANGAGGTFKPIFASEVAGSSVTISAQSIMRYRIYG